MVNLDLLQLKTRSKGFGRKPEGVGVMKDKEEKYNDDFLSFAPHTTDIT